MWYDEEFYDEPSEFENQVEDLKESLSKSIKSEFLEEMERLRKENKNLQGIKEHFEQIKRDYEQKKSECYRAMLEAEDKAKRMKVDELMKRFKTFFWRPDWEYLFGPKCDKCDESRRVNVILPSGKPVTDECQCEKSRMKVIVPQRMVRYELVDGYCGIVAYYRDCKGVSGKYYTLNSGHDVTAERNIVQSGTSFEVLEKKEDQRDILFATKEECFAYCEYLNKKNLVPADTIYTCEGDIWKEEESE